MSRNYVYIELTNAIEQAMLVGGFDKAISEGKIKKNSKVLIYAAENTQWQHALIYVKW